MKSKQALMMEDFLNQRGVTKANAARIIGMPYESFRGLFSGKSVWKAETVMALKSLLRLTDKELLEFLDSFSQKG